MSTTLFCATVRYPNRSKILLSQPYFRWHARSEHSNQFQDMRCAFNRRDFILSSNCQGQSIASGTASGGPELF
jgi:hypothetical protein